MSAILALKNNKDSLDNIKVVIGVVNIDNKNESRQEAKSLGISLGYIICLFIFSNLLHRLLKYTD